jgi:hypothetical protein
VTGDKKAKRPRCIEILIKDLGSAAGKRFELLIPADEIMLLTPGEIAARYLAPCWAQTAPYLLKALVAPTSAASGDAKPLDAERGET